MYNQFMENPVLNDFYEEQEEYVVDVPGMEEELVKEEVAEQEEKKETTTPTINYIAVIKIPKIGLEKGLASKDSYWNNVNFCYNTLGDIDNLKY